MKKTLTTACVAIALAFVGSVSTPDPAAGREASVCQFYKGDPVCKTVEESYCLSGVCRKTTEYWYWS